MYTLLAFLGAILLLISLHELGHLIVARWCGIKVLRFSVGFGKRLITKKWRNIEWCLSMIPLGGYVKMVDTREGKVASEDLPYAFDKQPPLKRIAVVVAGPLTNLILAVLLYWLSFGLGGINEVRPFVGEVAPFSIAQKAGFVSGDEIISIQGEPVHNFNDAYTKIILNLETGELPVQVKTQDGNLIIRTINATGTNDAKAVAKRKIGLGLSPFKMSQEIGVVQTHSPADKAGLKAGDRIIRVDNIAVPTWNDWVAIVEKNAGRNLQITYVRNNQEYQTQLMPDSVELENKIIGRVGVGAGIDKAWHEKVSYHYYPSLAQALQLGWQKTINYSTMNLSFFGKLVTGKASLAHISGPITIAEVAGKTAQIGWQAYIEFLALVSISLGVMNLLPIPVLDGGHLIYYTTELLRGKPLSKRTQELGVRLGLMVMLTMMILAFFNDITRLIG